MGKKGRNEKSNEVVTNHKTARQDANNYSSREDTTNHYKNIYSKQNRQQQQQEDEKYDRRIHDSKDYSSLKVVLFYCSLIVFVPVLTFFILKAFLLEMLFTLTDIQGNIYAAMGAVISLHIALGVYIYRAYFSADTTDKKRN